MAAGTTTYRGESRGYRVTFRIDPPSRCPVRHVDGNPTNLWVDVTDGEMRCDVMTADEEHEDWSISHFTKPLDEACPCRIFQRHETIPFQAIDGDQIRVAVHLDSTGTGKGLIADLSESQTAFQITDVTKIDDPENPPVVPIDHAALTDKQWQALELAAELGYYEVPAAVSLEEMSEMVAVSPSALGKRLQRAEQTIISQVTSYR